MKRSSNERPLYVCSWGTGSPEGWTRPNRSPVGWKSGNQNRVLRAIGLVRPIYAPSSIGPHRKAAALWRYLTRRHKRRRPRRAGRASRDAIKDRASIHDRPKTIEGRGEAGHWEGDLIIICKRTRPVLVLHERKKSRVTLAARLTAWKSAAETISVAMLAQCSAVSILICDDQSPSTTTPPSPSTPCSGPCAI